MDKVKAIGILQELTLWNWFWHHVTWVLGRREITFFWQRRTRGFDDSELWSLDHTFIKYMLPRLKAFRNLRNGAGPMGFPAGIIEDFGIGKLEQSEDGWSEYNNDISIAGYNKWLEVIDKMIWSMEHWVKTEGMPEFNEETNSFDQSLHNKYMEGMDLFHIYFHALWD